MGTTEIFLIAIGMIFTVPYLIWRVGRTDCYAPLVVVQILTGILLGPGMLGKAFPDYYDLVFTEAAVQALNGIAWWGVMLFVWLAGIELDLHEAWRHRRESAITASLALFTPLLLGSAVAVAMAGHEGWMGARTAPWQFVVGVGMACAVTALPVLILLMEKLEILRLPIGQRLLRYASLDDIAVWGVLALILMDWHRINMQVAFLFAFAACAYGVRRLMARLAQGDRWYVGLVWLVASALGADSAGLHFMVGAFIAGAVIDRHWFDLEDFDRVRRTVLLVMMPVYFLSAGLRTQWGAGGEAVLFTAAALLAASVAGKLLGVHAAGKLLRWAPGEAAAIGWLLQTKGLITIVFVNVLMDKGIVTRDAFTALLLMAVGSTMLTVPVVSPALARLKVLRRSRMAG